MKKKKRQELSKSISHGMIHEAAHLVASMALGEEAKPIEFRLLRTKTQYLFVGAVSRDRERFKRELADPEKREKVILNRLAVSFSGNIAHLQICGSEGFPGGGVQDMKEIASLLYDLVPEDRRETALSYFAAFLGLIQADAGSSR